MSRVVECIKCICGCNKLTKDRLKELISKNIHGFLNDQAAVDMFKIFIPKDSRTHKQLAIIEQAKAFHDMEELDTSNDEWEEFTEDLQEHLEDELKENPNTKEALETVIHYYSKEVESSQDFRNFSTNLREKYKNGRSRV